MARLQFARAKGEARLDHLKPRLRNFPTVKGLTPSSSYQTALRGMRRAGPAFECRADRRAISAGELPPGGLTTVDMKDNSCNE